ncbi:glycosyltransferase family 2 protein [Catenovulum maritimum]|uniref:Glycosyltransferase 2-like domain-containing protein n=1 Tax=Catenovulum maritimum TaxID=1513271 RepID=A0A0J8GZE4_9ALTE|nr:glycosyltransferase family 2 protein [Catenovulum maritimum]KMT66604.1 hypothetical protein XM47_03475 [Catenovulum maritimum]
MFSNKKAIQVLLPVYNCETYIRECILSIINQSFINFELIILDDCSTDNTFEIIKNCADVDERIKIIRNPSNLGIIVSRNKLIQLATADLVAFMDGDDICHPDRLKLQYNFLQANLNIAAVGSSYTILGESSLEYKLPTIHQDIMAHMFIDNAMCNPSVMVRLNELRQHSIECDINYRGAADYDMWLRLGAVCQLANLSQTLLYYRRHCEQESTSNRSRQQLAHLRVLEKLYVENSMPYDNELLAYLIWPGCQNLTYRTLINLGKYVNSLSESQNECTKFNSDLFKHLADIRYRGVCRRHKIKGLISYIATRGISGLLAGKFFGLVFAKDCIFSRG